VTAPSPLAIVPVKPPADAKRRLSPAVPVSLLPSLVRAVAEHVIEVCESGGAEVAVIAGDAEVARWADEIGVGVIPDPQIDLNAAIAAGVDLATAAGRPWCAVHADLPLLTPHDVATFLSLIRPGRAVLAPSRDGGTNLMGGLGHLPLRYGPGSFSRHLAMAADVERAVVVRIGTAVELDTPTDLAAVLRHPRGSWIRAHLG